LKKLVGSSANRKNFKKRKQTGSSVMTKLYVTGEVQ